MTKIVTFVLAKLRLENYAVIDNLVIEFASGLNLLTGKTGAGKSILIDTLGLLAIAALIRTYCSDARVEDDGVPLCVAPDEQVIVDPVQVHLRRGCIFLAHTMVTSTGLDFADALPFSMSVLRPIRSAHRPRRGASRSQLLGWHGEPLGDVQELRPPSSALTGIIRRPHPRGRPPSRPEGEVRVPATNRTSLV